MEASKVTPRRDWICVLEDFRETKLSSGIILPSRETGIEIVSENSGHVISIGPGEKNKNVGITPGDKIVYRGFIKHATKLESDEKWADGSPKNYFLMSVDDVMAVIPEETQVGAFSRKADE